MAALPPSAARDATVRTLFLKTDGKAYQDQPQLARSMGQALAKTETQDPNQQRALGGQYAQMLGTNEGRAFLSDTRVNGDARMWAAGQIAANPQQMQKLLAGQDKPWESAGVLQAYAETPTDRFAATRGDAQTVLKGGSDAYNFVGASLGAPMGAGKPNSDAEAAKDQALAAQGQHNYYGGVEAVQKAGDGINAAQRAMGGGDVKVSVLPIQFSSQSSGPVSLQLYKVDGQNGQSRRRSSAGRRC